MVKIIMHGCNGHMGQVISGLVEKDPDAEIVAGIDVADQGKNSYPVYTNMEECQVEADALIDFSSAKATDALLAYCEKRKLPVVLCTTGLSEEQLAKVEKGVAVVCVIEDLDVVLELCDRIAVFCGGKISGIEDGRTATKEEIGLLMTKHEKGGTQA